LECGDKDQEILAEAKYVEGEGRVEVWRSCTKLAQVDSENGSAVWCSRGPRLRL